MNLTWYICVYLYESPEANHYFPDLHHMKYEIEDGTVPDGKIFRFGFDPLEFPKFSWRGYAQMSDIQVLDREAVHTLSPTRGPQRWAVPKTDSSIDFLQSKDCDWRSD